MIKMHITLEGIPELESKLDRIQDVVSDFTPELRMIGEWYMGFIQNDVFETEGGVIGENWSPLNSKYALRKSKKYPGRGVLEASGKMRSSWKLYTTTHYALIENGADYAHWHQDGSPGGKIPQRMFVKITNQVEDKIYDIFEESILDRIQKAAR